MHMLSRGHKRIVALRQAVLCNRRPSNHENYASMQNGSRDRLLLGMAAHLEKDVNAFPGQEAAVEQEDEGLAEDRLKRRDCRLILCGLNAMGQDLHHSVYDTLH